MRTLVLKRILALLLIGLLAGLPAGPTAWAQAPTAGESPPPSPLSPQQLEELVGRIALYPDDLIAIILPAATFPLDVVSAERFLQKLKQDKTLKPDTRWHESVRNLLNYPEVIGMMSQDLDWTQDLGEAVVGQQADVVKAIQAFRAKAATAGNLKSDDKQIVVQENNVIQIVPADPQVIYIPQYQPQTVVVYQPAPPPPVYYPTPYPVYYYPYPPGAAFATGFFFGATLAYACHWGAWGVYAGVRYDDIQENRYNMQQNAQNAASQRQTQRQDSASERQAQRQDAASERQSQRQDAMQGGRQQGQGGGQASQQPRQGGSGPASGLQWQSQKKPGDVSQGRVSPRRAEARPGYGGSGGARGDSFGNPGRGSAAATDANRGVQSRGASASTMDRGGASRGTSASTMDRSGSSRGASGASAGATSRSGSSGGSRRGGRR
jgi:hypothetical protein